jgi:regulator of protease activity HflC (stomatin/prohibitin superfamily)
MQPCSAIFVLDRNISMLAPMYTKSEAKPLLVDPELGGLRRTPSTASAQQALAFPDELMLQQENSPAYKALHDAGLIVHAYRLKSSLELDVTGGNATVKSNFTRRLTAYVGGLGLGGFIYDKLVKQFTVKEGHVRPALHSDGSFYFYGPGVHRISGLFITVKEDVSLQTPRIEHGNCAIFTVPQGFIGLAFDRGQPTLLAPGMHQWKSDTLKLQELIDMSTDVIKLGPFTLLTVDEGYAAITQDNGKQIVLPGGATHMLTHRNWKYEKLISLKIHTDDLGPFRATSADNVVLETIATVNWRVQDPNLAARMADDTMYGHDDGYNAPVVGVGGSSILKQDVLKQAVASLAAAIGSIRYADDVHISASDKVNIETSEILPQQTPHSLGAGNDDGHGVSQIFSVQQMSAAAQHANEIVTQYGVSIVSINVISAVPMDKKLEETLSAGAVAAAGAVQAEIAARGNAKARLIDAQSVAAANRIQAQARADAEVMQAQGKKDAAALLESSNVAVDLAKLEKTGQVLGDNKSFFFGTSPSVLPALMSNPETFSKF